MPQILPELSPLQSMRIAVCGQSRAMDRSLFLFALSFIFCSLWLQSTEARLVFFRPEQDGPSSYEHADSDVFVVGYGTDRAVPRPVDAFRHDQMRPANG
uniref:Uncharacterized protein n=1 Tax=Plectus sambesii TaxID=2011161 RepID=A0A914WDT2_9BILA